LVFLKKQTFMAKKEGKIVGKEILMSLFFQEIADSLIMEMYLKSDFEKAERSLWKCLPPLPAFSQGQNPIEVITPYYERISDYRHPVQAALSAIVAIPVVQLIVNTIRF
jgi:hypothetical protein